MEENTYYSVAAKWWADEAREVNEIYEMELAEELFRDFEKELAVIIKDTVEAYIKSRQEHKQKYPDYHNYYSEFPEVSLRANLDILNDAFRNSKIRCTLSGLPKHYIMLVSQNLVLVRELDVWKRYRMSLPSIDTDQLLFNAR